jgi:uncharacterized protein (DUF1800 family)
LRAVATSPPADPFASPMASADMPLEQRWVCHLLRRAAMGVSAEWVRAFAGKNAVQIIDALTSYDATDDAPYAEMIRGLSGALSVIDSADEAQRWWIFRMLDTPRPLQERMALLWHNHFATSTGKVRQAALVSRQIDIFRRLGLGNFRELLLAVTKDAAMLLWLDGSQNKRGRPNENYAREVMELFTLGIGNYGEKDVQELARAFTGWQVLDESVEFFPGAFDGGEKKILGERGKFNAEGAVDLLLRQSAAPQHIARKLLKEFVHPQPLAEHVVHYAGRLVHFKWEIKPVLKEMLNSRLFFSEYAWRSKIKSPCELVMGAMLGLGAVRDTTMARDAMNKMGQTLLAPPSVKGWDGEEVWINANTVLQRYNFALDLVMKLDARALLRLLERRELGTAEKVVDYFAGVLLDGRIEAEAWGRLVEYLKGGKKFAMSLEAVENVRGVVRLMMCMPEYQLG